MYVWIFNIIYAYVYPYIFYLAFVVKKINTLNTDFDRTNYVSKKYI